MQKIIVFLMSFVSGMAASGLGFVLFGFEKVIEIHGEENNILVIFVAWATAITTLLFFLLLSNQISESRYK